jgi:hypothetical protein
MSERRRLTVVPGSVVWVPEAGREVGVVAVTAASAACAEATALEAETYIVCI